MAGYRYKSEGLPYNQSTIGYYWSSTIKLPDKPIRLGFHKRSTNISVSNLGGSFSVRCVQESSNINYQKDMNKITKSEIVQSDKRHRIIGGLYITFNSEDVKVGDYVGLRIDIKHPFKVISVKTSGDLLEACAVETGFFANKISRNPFFNPKQIIGYGLEPIVDENEIREIREESLLT